MAYDQKNAYPDEVKVPDRSSATTASGEYEKSLRKRALSLMVQWKDDMEYLQKERTKFMKYYNADKLGNEVDGRSKVVMSDVFDTIESIMPSLMKVFYSGKNILDIRAQGKEDETKAKLMSEKVNFDIQKGMNGFKLLYSWFKDALINKMGVVKYVWEKGEKYKKVKFKGLTEQEYSALAMDPKYKIDKVKKIVPEVPKAMEDMVELMGMTTYDIEAREVRPYSKPMAYNVPPEEFLFDLKSSELKEYIHKKKIHRSQLKKYGVSDDEMRAYMDEISDSAILDERYKDLGGMTFVTEDKNTPYVYIYECYLCDYDEDGNEQKKIVTVFNDKVLKVEDNDGGAGFVTLSPIMISHRVCGKSMAELVTEVQELRTALVRYILDSVYFGANGMNVVNPYRIDVDSLITGNRPGGMVFTKGDTDPTNAIMPVPVAPLNAPVLKLLEYVEGSMRENRTGVTRYNQGLDAKSLNKTATGISQIMGAAQMRIELIARIFAETGVRDLYQAFVDMNIEFFDMETNIKINDEWITIKPEDIDGMFDVVIDIGSSTGTKEIQFQQKVQMLNIYQGIAQILGPAMTQIVTIENVKNMIRTMWEDLGFRNTDLFVAPESIGGMNGQPQGLANPIGGGPQAVGAPPVGGVLPELGGAGQEQLLAMPGGQPGNPRGY